MLQALLCVETDSLSHELWWRLDLIFINPSSLSLSYETKPYDFILFEVAVYTYDLLIRGEILELPVIIAAAPF